MIRKLILKYLSRSFSIVKTIYNTDINYVGYNIFLGYKYKLTYENGKEIYMYFPDYLISFYRGGSIKNVDCYQINENTYIVKKIHGEKL